MLLLKCMKGASSPSYYYYYYYSICKAEQCLAASLLSFLNDWHLMYNYSSLHYWVVFLLLSVYKNRNFRNRQVESNRFDVWRNPAGVFLQPTSLSLQPEYPPWPVNTTSSPAWLIHQTYPVSAETVSMVFWIIVIQETPGTYEFRGRASPVWIPKHHKAVPLYAKCN